MQLNSCYLAMNHGTITDPSIIIMVPPYTVLSFGGKNLPNSCFVSKRRFLHSFRFNRVFFAVIVVCILTNQTFSKKIRSKNFPTTIKVHFWWSVGNRQEGNVLSELPAPCSELLALKVAQFPAGSQSDKLEQFKLYAWRRKPCVQIVFFTWWLSLLLYLITQYCIIWFKYL